MSESTRPLVIANWKMNLDFVESVHWSQQVGVILKNRPADHVDVVVAPPFVDLRSVSSVLVSERIPVALGAQHVSANDAGAYTGEISCAMLQRLNVTWVLVGHSERRALYAMDDAVVAATLRTVVRAGLEPVLCVGEDASVRDAGRAEEYVRAQLDSALGALNEPLVTPVTVAYEPVWAIGSGATAAPEQIAAMTDFIRSVLVGYVTGTSRVLYGGSVNGENASTLMSDGRVDGFLVGGASLKAESFVSVVQACDDCYAGKR